jgi:hypothetical protein
MSIFGLDLHWWEQLMLFSLLAVFATTLSVVILQRRENAQTKREYEEYKLTADARVADAKREGIAAGEKAGNAMLRAAELEKEAEELKKGNLTLARDLERERMERVKMEERFGARHFTQAQKEAVLAAFKGRPITVHVRCIAEGEACLAAENFAAVLREAGLSVPPVKDVGLTIPPTLGIEVWDPDGQNGLFAKTMLANISEAKLRPVPFQIGGEVTDPTIPAMVVRYRTRQ